MLVQDPNRDTTNVHTQFSTFRQDSYYYYLNMFQQPDWDGSRAGFYRDLKHYSYNQLRKQSNNIINNGGWHFSFQGGADKVKKKIESYSHQELNTDYIKSNIAVKIEKQVDPFFRSSLTVVPIDLRFPEYLRNNIDKYKHMIIIKQTIMENKPNFLCISNYNNDISWVKDFPNEHLIYDRSETPVVIDGYHVEQPPNIGYNLYDIFTFIIDHYDSLPDVTTFCKGNVFPRHVRREVFEQLVNSKCFTSIFDVTMHKPEMPMCMFSSDGSWSERNNHQVMIDAAAHPAKYFLTYDSLLRFIFDDPLIPKYITFSPGANYVVPKEYILKYSRTFYENLRFFISHNTLPTETHLIERALYSMWMGNFKASERMADVITDENYRSIFVPPYITGIEEKEKKNGQVDVSAKLSKDANSAGSEIGFYDNLECRFEIVVRDTQHPFLFMSLEQRVLQNKPELSSAFRSNVDDFIKVHKTLAEAEIYLDNDIMPMTTKRLDFSIMKLYVKA